MMSVYICINTVCGGGETLSIVICFSAWLVVVLQKILHGRLVSGNKL